VRCDIKKSNTPTTLILLTNDDGFFARGIKTLFRNLANVGEVYIVAPDKEYSATSLCLTLHHPLRVKAIEDHIYAIDGTPADCVYMAVQKLLPRKPDLLISGMNHGPNVGQQDISYSGTVAGAVQGTFLQIPSVAISLSADEKGQFPFELGAKFGTLVAKKLLDNALPQGMALNINIPPPPVKGVKLTKLGQKRYHPEIIVKTDPRGRTYYWIGTGNPKGEGDKDSDVMVIQKGYITVTPIHRDLTDYNALELPKLKNIFSSLNDEIL